MDLGLDFGQILRIGFGLDLCSKMKGFCATLKTSTVEMRYKLQRAQISGNKVLADLSSTKTELVSTKFRT